MNPKTFATLIRKFRLLSGLATLDEFADKLGEYDYYIDISIISHWQNGNRTPRDRKLLLTIIKIFVNLQGIKTHVDANELLASTNMGYLTSQELKSLFPHEVDELSMSARFTKIQSIDTMSTYYLRFLNQAKRGSFVYYDEIEHEKQHIELILDQCLEYKFYDRYLALWHHLSPFYWDRGYWSEFEKISRKAYGIACIIESQQQQIRCLVEDLSWLYYWSGRIEEEQNLLDEASNITTLPNENNLHSLYYLRKGLIHKDNKKFSEANKCLVKAFTYYKDCKNTDLISKSALYLGHLRQDEKKLDEAEKYYQIALIAGKDVINENEAKALYYLGEINFQMNKRDKAKQFFSSALEIDKKNSRISGYGWNYYGLARCNSGSHQQRLATKASDCFSKLQMYDQAKISKQLAHNNTELVLF